jgi:electron transfer flavoprotein alpha subunit
MRKTLIFVERNAWRDALDLREAAERIFPEGAHAVYGAAFNLDDPDAVKAVRSGFDYVISIADERIADHDAVNSAASMADIQRTYDFDCILIAATSFGRVLAPRLAMALNAPLCADVTSVEHRDGELYLVRPAFDGKMLAAVSVTGRKPFMASIRRGVFSRNALEPKEGELLEYRPGNLKPWGVRLLGTHNKEESEDIRKSAVLVSAGAGVGRFFEKVRALAEELGGMAASSRKLVDKGIAPRSIQVGQSGKTVCPKLYIALGINGAIQHVEGIKHAEYIISVNVNKDAPLCSLSDMVVEGDAVEFAEKLTAKIKDRRKITI